MSNKEPQPTPRNDALSTLARERAETIGRDWAIELKASILLEQRRACGGWPGTLSEARARVLISLLPWLRLNGQPVVTTAQREDAARHLYASARSAWMETRDPDEDP